MAPTHDAPSIRHRLGRRGGLLLAGLALLGIGGGAGAIAVGATRPAVVMAPATPVAIRTLATAGSDTSAGTQVVTIRGRIAEVYGDRFILADASGRMLVDGGRGDDGRFVVGQPLTVQGRYDHGSVHAAFLVDAAGRVTQAGPVGGPPHGPGGPGGRGGPGRDGPDGPDGPRGRDGTPPPPAPAPSAATTTPAPAAAPATPVPAR